MQSNGSRTVKYTYDKYDRLETKTDAKGHTLAYAYDEAGRLKSLDSGYGKTSYEYDILDRVTKVIDRNGKATIYCNAPFFRGIACANRFAKRIFIRFAPSTNTT